MNIVFAGTPHFALPSLAALAKSTHQLTAVYTQPDRPAGRGHKLQASPVKQWAEQHHIPIIQPLNFKTQDTVNQLAALKPEVMIVIAYGLILPQTVLEIPRYGCINVHASLLPRWRGASPIQQAILQGDNETGITVMQMDSGMDTGAILTQVTCPITNTTTAGQLHDRLSQEAVTPLLALLEHLSAGTHNAEAQNNALATYAPKITKEDAAIQWHLPATIIDRQIRAFNPWPIAYTHTPQEILRIHQARPIHKPSTAAPGTLVSISADGLLVATGQAMILIERLQFAGGRAISVADYLNAPHHRLSINMVLQ